MKGLEGRLREDFSEREYRETYASGFLSTWISQQLTTIRRQRRLTQHQLAEIVGTKQSGISRMERDDYGRWKIPVLQKVAFALGCRLKVSLETFGSLVHEASDFSERALERPPFEEDLVFNPRSEIDRLVASSSGPLGEMRRKVIPWLLNKGPKEQLADWLQGYDLPAVGDEIPPSEWLLRSITLPDDPKCDEEMRVAFASNLRDVIQDRWDIQPPGQRKSDLVKNLLHLFRGLRQPAILGESAWKIYERRRDLAYAPVLEEDVPAPLHPLVGAVLYNQMEGRFMPMWNHYLQSPPAGLEEDYLVTGFLGMAHVSPTPNIPEIVRVAGSSGGWYLPPSQTIRILKTSFERIWSDFPTQLRLKTQVIERARTAPHGWSEAAIVAWEKSLSHDLPAQRAGIHRELEHIVRFAEQSPLAAAAVA